MANFFCSYHIFVKTYTIQSYKTGRLSTVTVCKRLIKHIHLHIWTHYLDWMQYFIYVCFCNLIRMLCWWFIQVFWIHWNLKHDLWTDYHPADDEHYFEFHFYNTVETIFTSMRMSQKLFVLILSLCNSTLRLLCHCAVKTLWVKSFISSSQSILLQCMSRYNNSSVFMEGVVILKAAFLCKP